MKIINFEYRSEWFKSAYYVYVLEIKHKTKGTFYYIGQTGDRNHTAARSPFYRLWGHFNPYNTKSGTDSQLIKGLIKKKLLLKDDNIRKQIDKSFAEGEISLNAKYYKISDFDSSNHTQKREQVEKIELSLINLFMHNKKIIFNEKTNTIPIKNIEKEAVEIFQYYK